MRKVDRFPVEGPNPLFRMYSTVSFLKVVKNFIVIQTSRYTPWITVKNILFRLFLRMEVGEHSAFALMAMPDLLFPEKIKVGRNTIIGYNTTILTHEYLTHEYRTGNVVIGDNVMIGANTTILPGVTIGDGAVVSAGSLVHKDVPAGMMAGGNPLQFIRKI
ncbi:acyltransferase [Aciduricibacillus chroicocephali]|uniref:Acyltransferase n=1 Tax=Aciduricibacillus chroicocephali TaxID=3054939 RepID=A0ABY9KTA0_9BACI|nr:acyltransferase [Bacillaceae bacterium 44XB]